MGVRCGQTMLRRTGVWSIGQPGFPSWPAEAEQVEQLEERPGHGPDPRFWCPTGDPDPWTAPGVRRADPRPARRQHRHGGRGSKARRAVLASAHPGGGLRFRPTLSLPAEGPAPRAGRRRRPPDRLPEPGPRLRHASPAPAGAGGRRVRAPSLGRASLCPARGKHRGRNKPRILLFRSRQPAPTPHRERGAGMSRRT
jgi:hypothetical protein